MIQSDFIFPLTRINDGEGGRDIGITTASSWFRFHLGAVTREGSVDIRGNEREAGEGRKNTRETALDTVVSPD